MEITCTDRVDRLHVQEFVFEANKKFAELNEQCGLTQKLLSFPVLEMEDALKRAFTERESPRFLFGHITYDFNRNRAELFVGMFSDDSTKFKDVYGLVKIFSGRFLQ